MDTRACNGCPSGSSPPRAQDFFRPLVERGADPNLRETAMYPDFDGSRSAMHYAAHFGDVEAFKLLRELGGELEASAGPAGARSL